MRGGGADNGRFSIAYEALSMYEGIGEELGATVGTTIDWWKWQEDYFTTHYTTIVDDIYDVSSSVAGQGRHWHPKMVMPVVMAQLLRSTNVMNERGYYVSDTLRIVLNVGDVQRLLPDLLANPNGHIKDRIVYRGEVFVPTRVIPRGAFGFRYAVVTIDCNQVNPEELVNDPQFQTYAQKSVVELRTIGYGNGYYGSDAYGE
jgi:hypothetical protein